MKNFLKSLLILLGVGLLSFYFFQELFLFRPGKKLAKNVVFHFPNTFKEVNLTAPDNETINAVHFTLENPKGIVLFFHGNRGNLNRWGQLASNFLDYHYEVFMIDYRGYGKSTGDFNEHDMYNDALLAYEYVLDTYEQENIIVYGYSLGSTFAARIGATHQPKHIILEAPFYSFKRAVRHNFMLAPIFLMRYSFNSFADVPKITSPITIFHGTNDKTTSHKESLDLYNLLLIENKQFISLDGGGHRDLITFDRYQEELKKILH
jgi:alpha-beta hydrolase superfamily lysophospholipase